MTIVWVSAKDIKDIHDEKNPDNPLGYHKARAIKKECIKRYHEEFGEVERYDSRLIPLEWYERYFGQRFSTKNKKKKDTSTSTKQ